ncbi:hypothetical protein L1D32_17625 [Shewanella insulae]|uniref:Lipoprotein n=1 Tax=Shewanella insulae TaxID=2681496 RepID=A0A6L7I138_9GAMM|nr:hypothetical protein [Shewanella insulae]MCG9739987.1 hypothetical protein [Shewanella insulae]MCG9756353.1 hypothetical protein [Shewanella insulae]MXR70286.1 hypothetical protein [Shewanella insulae]
MISTIKHTFVGLFALASLSGCASALCGAQTDHATNPLQRENNRLECERQVMSAMDEHERKQKRESDELLKAYLDKHLKEAH